MPKHGAEHGQRRFDVYHGCTLGEASHELLAIGRNRRVPLCIRDAHNGRQPTSPARELIRHSVFSSAPATLTAADTWLRCPAMITLSGAERNRETLSVSFRSKLHHCGLSVRSTSTGTRRSQLGRGTHGATRNDGWWDRRMLPGSFDEVINTHVTLTNACRGTRCARRDTHNARGILTEAGSPRTTWTTSSR